MDGRGRVRVVEEQRAAGARGRDDITPGLAGTQGPQPCLRQVQGKGEEVGERGLGGGWIIPGLIPFSSGFSPLQSAPVI